MSKFDEAIELYTSEMNRLDLGCDADLLKKVAKGLGPSIYNRDASLVSTSDPEELARVKKNFLIKKLGMTDSSELDDAVKAVGEKFGKGNRNKHRAIYYYLLVKHFGMESHYA